mgnify:CR=1 FL=1
MSALKSSRHSQLTRDKARQSHVRYVPTAPNVRRAAPPAFEPSGVFGEMLAALPAIAAAAPAVVSAAAATLSALRQREVESVSTRAFQDGVKKKLGLKEKEYQQLRKLVKAMDEDNSGDIDKYEQSAALLALCPGEKCPALSDDAGVELYESPPKPPLSPTGKKAVLTQFKKRLQKTQKKWSTQISQWVSDTTPYKLALQSVGSVFDSMQFDKLGTEGGKMVRELLTRKSLLFVMMWNEDFLNAWEKKDDKRMVELVDNGMVELAARFQTPITSLEKEAEVNALLKEMEANPQHPLQALTTDFEFKSAKLHNVAMEELPSLWQSKDKEDIKRQLRFLTLTKVVARFAEMGREYARRTQVLQARALLDPDKRDAYDTLVQGVKLNFLTSAEPNTKQLNELKESTRKTVAHCEALQACGTRAAWNNAIKELKIEESHTLADEALRVTSYLYNMKDGQWVEIERGAADTVTLATLHDLTATFNTWLTDLVADISLKYILIAICPAFLAAASKVFFKCLKASCVGGGASKKISKKGGSVGKPETETKHGYMHYYYSGKRGKDYKHSKFILARVEDGRWQRYRPDSLPALVSYGNLQWAKPRNTHQWEDIVLKKTEFGEWTTKMEAYRRKIRQRILRQAEE